MSIQINIKNSTIKNNAKLMSNTKINFQNLIKIDIDNIKQKGDSSILENLEIEEVLADLKSSLSSLDSNTTEYQELKRLLEAEPTSKKNLLLNHLANFSQGLLSGLIVNWISKQP